MAQLTLRTMASADGALLNDLTTSSPDTGLIAVYRRYEIDPYRALQVLKPGSVGVVAEVADHPDLAGAALVTPQLVQLGAEVRSAACLSRLVVHPAVRRRGVATRLGSWRLQYVRETMGEDVPIFAYLQRGNRHSLAVARRWLTQALGPIKIAGLPPRARPPEERAFTVRAAEPGELEEIAARLNAFYRDHLFYPRESAETLQSWLEATPLDTPFRHYYVVVDRAGRLLAGAAIAETARLMTEHIVRMPLALRLANHVLKVVSPEGMLREVSVGKLWFREGALEAARYLLETLRWRYRESGNLLRLEFDPRSPLAKVVSLPFWWPTAGGILVLRSATALAEDKPIYVEM
jgi:GNAT superfamily N-acetyltransferase